MWPSKLRPPHRGDRPDAPTGMPADGHRGGEVVAFPVPRRPAAPKAAEGSTPAPTPAPTLAPPTASRAAPATVRTARSPVRRTALRLVRDGVNGEPDNGASSDEAPRERAATSPRPQVRPVAPRRRRPSGLDDTAATLAPVEHVLLSPDDPSLHPVLAKRWSSRSFAPDRIVEEETLARCLQAARWASSTANTQPCRFIVGRRADSTFVGIRNALALHDRVWADRASVLLVTVARRYDDLGSPYRLSDYDLGQAVAQLTCQATASGLTVQQISRFEVDQTRTRFHIPDDFDPVTVLALGERAHPNALPAPLAQRDRKRRTRRPVARIAYSRTWGRPWTASPTTSRRSTSAPDPSRRV
jgi:nitroreductase